MAAAGVRAYIWRVTSILARSLLMLAVVFLALGMGQSAVAKSPSMAGMEMGAGHCPDGSTNHGGKSMPGDCTMACASALPAFDLPRPQPVSVAKMPMQPLLSPRLPGILLDIATPPPRTA